MKGKPQALSYLKIWYGAKRPKVKCFPDGSKLYRSNDADTKTGIFDPESGVDKLRQLLKRHAAMFDIKSAIIRGFWNANYQPKQQQWKALTDEQAPKKSLKPLPMLRAWVVFPEHIQKVREQQGNHPNAILFSEELEQFTTKKKTWIEDLAFESLINRILPYKKYVQMVIFYHNYECNPKKVYARLRRGQILYDQKAENLKDMRHYWRFLENKVQALENEQTEMELIS